jgi:hypothetical protein
MRSSATATVCAGPTISYRSCSRISSSNIVIRGSSSSKRTRGIKLSPCQKSVVIPHRGYPRTRSGEASHDNRAAWFAVTNATGSPAPHCCLLAWPSFPFARDPTAIYTPAAGPRATPTEAKGSTALPCNSERLAMSLVGASRLGPVYIRYSGRDSR